MARKGGKSSAGKALARAKAFPLEDPLQSSEVIHLTARFQELKKQLFRDAVDTVIELGEILREGRNLLSGRYGKWVESLGISAKTAYNYETLSRLAEEHPRLIQQFKELGPTKLYRLGEIEEKGRKKIIKDHTPDDLLAMTQLEFAEIVRPYVRKRRPVTPDMRAHGLRMKIQSWLKTLSSSNVGKIKNKDLRSSLRVDLKELAALARKLAGKV